jgi:hypothetical protein
VEIHSDGAPEGKIPRQEKLFLAGIMARLLEVMVRILPICAHANSGPQAEAV